MFPLYQGNELCFKISSNTNQQQKIPEDLILDHPELLYACTDVTHNVSTKSRTPKFISMDNNNHGNDNSTLSPGLLSSDKKKLMHRDIERQRRQEMATLYASLRSLLPLEYIKGKRSTSDHMSEAVNYIMHLRKRIKELDAKRDELKQQVNLRVIPLQTSTGSSSNCSQSTGVVIRPSLGGVEIAFSSGLSEKGQGLALSEVLQVLLEAEISVVNCVSTKVNERVFHTVQTEVKDPASLNLFELQQKLNSLAL